MAGLSRETSAPLTRPAIVLAILILVYVVNVVDRMIIGILATPIKADLELTDTQLGLLGGFAFAVFYAVAGMPIAWAADRRSRVTIIAAAILLWSLCTSLCGVAKGFTHLFLARMGVGIGEAGGMAPSYSLITDYFPQAQRARALAIFSFGSPIGGAIGILLGGWMATHFDWRAAFIAIGAIGLPVAALVRFGIVEPPRARFDAQAAAAPTLRVAADALLRNRTFWLVSAGATLSNVPIYGLMFWLPSYFTRSLGLGMMEISWFYGSIVLIGGVAGMWCGGWLGDRFARRSLSAYVLVPALSFLLSAPCYALALFVPDMASAWILFLIPQTLAFLYTGPMLTAVNHIVPPAMRATASAAFLMIANLIGTGLGTVFLGVVSDRMTTGHGPDGLRYALLCGLAFYPFAALCFALAARTIARDWQGARPEAG